MYFPFDSADGISLINGAVWTSGGKVRWADEISTIFSDVCCFCLCNRM